MLSPKQELVFVEVRARSNLQHGGALASVGFKKQASLIKAAQHYLMKFRVLPCCRFDVIGVSAGHTEWIQGAFEA